MIEPVTTECSFNATNTISVPYTPTITTVKSTGVSLVGYSGVVSTVITFEISIVSISTTEVTMSLKCRENSMMTRLRFMYIIVGTTVLYLDVYSDCFLCLPQDTLDGNRYHQFSNQ